MLLTTASARAAGLTPVDVARRVRQGSWLRLDRGVFVPANAWAGLDEPARHLLRARARLVVLGPAWSLARRSALLAHDVPFLGDVPERPQLLGAKDRAKARTRHERIATLPPEDVAVLAGWRTTTLERTVVDLARGEPLRSAVVAADGALRRGLDHERALALARRCEDWPGGRRAAAALRLADGRAESPLETVSRLGLLWQGLEVPELQVEVWLGAVRVGRVDFLWRRNRLVGEADGLGKYVDLGTVVREKQREEALRAAGLEVVRWNWEHAWRDRGREMADRVRHGTALGAGRVLDPRVRFVTTQPRPLPALA